ncbi:MAG: amidohydrolase family protein [Bacteroides sp.]|nr:amidohydrolase family protein [Prevotella sp.]MCM1408909.1 amidohydrolase family protein [Treponema brennaborense]MCM1470836.1 amidohydrolase family protein [Bacteroides sp.]
MQRIIDFHAHIYPRKIAQKATQSVGKFYDAPIAWHGLSEELLKSGAAIGVEKYVVHSVATKPEQVISINDFIIAECAEHSQFIGFATMHPGFAGAEYGGFGTELERIKRLGLRGVKLHPDFQKFAADDAVMDDAYDIMASLHLPVLFHAGDSRYHFSNPALIAHVLEKHPALTVIAAHFGGYTEWQESEEYLCGKNVYFDTSSTSWKLSVEKQREMIQKHGCERFLFGSDFPMWDHADEFSRYRQLELTETQNRAILYENAEKLLGL